MMKHISLYKFLTNIWEGKLVRIIKSKETFINAPCLHKSILADFLNISTKLTTLLIKKTSEQT
jgi:hypothetical protein